MRRVDDDLENQPGCTLGMGVTALRVTICKSRPPLATSIAALLQSDGEACGTVARLCHSSRTVEKQTSWVVRINLCEIDGTIGATCQHLRLRGYARGCWWGCWGWELLVAALG